MSESDLSIQGDISETTVPDLFRSLVRSSETAVVTLETEYNDVIYFNEGRIIYASSTDPDMGLAETLMRIGQLNLQQYNSAMERVVLARRMGALLCEMGYLEPDELLRGVEQQSSAIVLNVIGYRRGNYTIEFTSEFPDDIIALPLSTERLILDGVGRIEEWSLIARGVVRLERLLEHVPGSDMRSYTMELSDDETHVLSLLAEPTSIQDLCSRSYLSNFVTCRTLWGLLAVNLVQDAEGTGMVEKRAAEATEYELEDLVEQYNTVFQAIFAKAFQKIGDHVYDFMDRVVTHLSPDMAPYLSGMTMVNEGRVDFDQILNNIFASGSTDHGAVVQQVLNELLYGWIVEVKREFGTGMEAEVVKLAESVRSR